MEICATTTNSALDMWLVHLKHSEDSEDFITFCEETVGQFNQGLAKFFNVISTGHIGHHHVGTYYFVFLDVLAIGLMTKNTVPSELFTVVNNRECTDEEYTIFHFAIIKSFLTYCWTEKLIGADFLEWSWAEDDLRKAADEASRFH